MKRLSLAIGSIIFLALAVMVYASDFTLLNNNPTLSGNINTVLNGTLTFTNSGSDNLTVSSIDFLGFQNSKFTFPSSAFTNNGIGLYVLPGGSNTKTINYTVSLANNPFSGTYAGTVNVTTYNQSLSFITKSALLSIVVNPAKNATGSISTATIVQGQIGSATLSANNIGNTDLNFNSFFAAVMNSTGQPLVSSILYPTNLFAAYQYGNSTNFNLTVLPTAAPGTYAYNMTLSDGSLSVIAPGTLTILAISENVQSSSLNGQIKVDGTNVIKQTAIPITITNNGNVDEPVALIISNLVSTTNSSNVIPSTTLSYNPSNSATVIKNAGTQAINVTSGIGGSIPLGQYRGNLSLVYGCTSGCTQKTLNSTVLLDVVQAQASLSLPVVTLAGSRNSSAYNEFTVTNTGDFALNIQSITSTADSKYNVSFKVVGNNFYIPVGGNTTLNATGYIPTAQSSGAIKIGTLTVTTDKANATNDLLVNAASSLTFSDMDIKSSESSTHFRLEDMNSSVLVKPGSTLTVKSTALNNFTSSMRIKQITVTARINDINRLNDGDSFLQQETNEFSLNSQSSKTNSFDFTIPLRVEQKNYTLVVTADGVDDTNARHKATWSMSLDFEKDSSSVSTALSVDPSSLTCGNPATLKIDVVNTGTDDQNAGVTVSSGAFGISQDYTNISLSGDARDDTSVYTINQDFNVPVGLNTTSYLITVDTRFGGKTDRNTLNVPVSGSQCTGIVAPEPPVVINPPINGGQTVATIPGSFLDSGKVWYKQPWYLALLIVADGLLVIIILWLIIGAVKRR